MSLVVCYPHKDEFDIITDGIKMVLQILLSQTQKNKTTPPMIEKLECLT